jgi:hypothetical protein
MVFSLSENTENGQWDNYGDRWNIWVLNTEDEIIFVNCTHLSIIAVGFTSVLRLICQVDAVGRKTIRLYNGNFQKCDFLSIKAEQSSM